LLVEENPSIAVHRVTLHCHGRRPECLICLSDPSGPRPSRALLGGTPFMPHWAILNVHYREWPQNPAGPDPVESISEDLELPSVCSHVCPEVHWWIRLAAGAGHGPRPEPNVVIYCLHRYCCQMKFPWCEMVTFIWKLEVSTTSGRSNF
jgi:hypothetical protein